MTLNFLPQNKVLKVVTVVFGIWLILTFLPFAIGGGLAYLVYKRVPAGQMKNGFLLAIILPTLFVGSAWTAGLISSWNTNKTIQPAKVEAPKPSPSQITPSVIEQKSQTEVLGSEATASVAAKILYPVTKVIDGDTINVAINGKTETLRLIGIDSPETVDPRKPVQCFGIEASNKAKELLSGKRVALVGDTTQGEWDKYNRLLRYVFLEDGTNFNKLMIGEGYAHEYTYQIPYKYQAEFKQAEVEARTNKKGLWADNACPIPTTTTTNVAQPTPTTNPTPTYQAPSNSQPKSSSGSYNCDCSKTCTQIATCDEAYFQLNQCGCTKRDADHDGIPCESLCQ